MVAKIFPTSICPRWRFEDTSRPTMRICISFFPKRFLSGFSKLPHRSCFLKPVIAVTGSTKMVISATSKLPSSFYLKTDRLGTDARPPVAVPRLLNLSLPGHICKLLETQWCFLLLTFFLFQSWTSASCSPMPTPPLDFKSR